jgi:hypothetical protein
MTFRVGHGALCPLQDRNGHMLVHSARSSAPWKFYFTLGYAVAGQESESWKSDIFSLMLEIRKKDERKKLWKYSNKGWILFVFRTSTWLSVGTSRDEVPETIKETINTKKCLISVIWSMNGIHSLFDLSKGTTYNSAFFSDWVLLDLVEHFCAQRRRDTVKSIFVHLNKASRPNSKQSCEGLEGICARRVPHHAYNPNQAPNDFFFG